MIISGLCFALAHATVKFLPRLPSYELVFFRQAISLLLTYAMLRHLRISPAGNNKRALIARGVFGTLALTSFFYTLQTMPLASAVTIQYLNPIFTVILAGFLLKESPSLIQWLFFGASFGGVLLVQGFDARVSFMGALIGVFSALFSAAAYNMIRVLKNHDHPLVVMFYFPMVSILFLGPYTAFNWVQPQGTEWFFLLLIGVLTQVAQYFMTLAYQADRAANVSNLNYLGVIYALAIGSFIFNETVTVISLVGMAVIAVSAILSTRFQKR